MSAHCCEDKSEELAQLRRTQGRVVKVVLAINAAMFLIEFTAGVLGRSTALLADSLDMLGDTAVYAFSLFVLERSARWKAGAAVTKGVIMAAFGLGVTAQVLVKTLSGTVPAAETMGAIGALALGANLTCLVLLLRYRDADLNMRSTWLCSRNDVIANVGVLVAAAAVALTGSKWPDIAVGGIIAALFLSSAWGVLREALTALRNTRGSDRPGEKAHQGSHV